MNAAMARNIGDVLANAPDAMMEKMAEGQGGLGNIARQLMAARESSPSLQPQQMQQPLTPQGGVASLGNRQDMADKLANMGQFDDDQIAHVAEGEVIVPAPIIKYYPEVRDQIFTLIRKEGLDPEEFIVGGDLVARNPNTGLMEFGWLSKTFKKIKKAFKKIAPIVLPFVLPGIGTCLLYTSDAADE